MGIPRERFIDRNHEQFLCSICLDVSFPAVVTNDCEHFFCRSCIESLRNGADRRCPTCQSILKTPKWSSIRGSTKRIYLDLMIKCLIDECDHVSDMTNFDVHDKNCPLIIITCPDCGFECGPSTAHCCVQYLKSVISKKDEIIEQKNLKINETEEIIGQLVNRCREYDIQIEEYKATSCVDFLKSVINEKDGTIGQMAERIKETEKQIAYLKHRRNASRGSSAQSMLEWNIYKKEETRMKERCKRSEDLKREQIECENHRWKITQLEESVKQSNDNLKRERAIRENYIERVHENEKQIKILEESCKHHQKMMEESNGMCQVYKTKLAEVETKYRSQLEPISSEASNDQLSVRKHTSTIKIILLGAPQVGKTLIVNQFIAIKKYTKYKHTLEPKTYFCSRLIDGKEYEFQLVDMPGSRKFRMNGDQSQINQADVVMLVYDYSNYYTLKYLDSWMEILSNNQTLANVPQILVGNDWDPFHPPANSHDE